MVGLVGIRGSAEQNGWFRMAMSLKIPSLSKPLRGSLVPPANGFTATCEMEHSNSAGCGYSGNRAARAA
jgi:hypothetical protein